VSGVIQFPRRARATSESGIRLRRLDEGSLVLPPVRLRDLPGTGVVGRFMGALALRFQTANETIAVFLHDLCPEDQAALLDEQRRVACAQLGAQYATEGENTRA
jgi:hypothetical protein